MLHNKLEFNTFTKSISLSLVESILSYLSIINAKIEVTLTNNHDELENWYRVCVEDFLLDPNIRQQINRKLIDYGVPYDKVATLNLQISEECVKLIQRRHYNAESEENSTNSPNNNDGRVIVKFSDSGTVAFNKYENGSIFANSFALSSIVTWDDIIAETNDPNKIIEKLLEVKYIDDVLPDWPEFIRPFLKENLEKNLLLLKEGTTNMTVSNHEHEGFDATLINENLNKAILLYRKWFHLTRSNREYDLFQTEIVDDLLHSVIVQMPNMLRSDPVQCHPSGRKNTDYTQALKRIGLTVMDMFTDWVDNIHIMNSFIRNEQKENLGHFIFCSNVPAELDPSATWFHCWISLLPCDKIYSLFLPKGTNSRTDDMGDDDDSKNDDSHRWSKFGSSFKSLFLHACEYLSLEQSNVEGHCLYSLSIIRFILIATRVENFPWRIFGPDKEKQQINLFNVYLRLLKNILWNDAPDDCSGTTSMEDGVLTTPFRSIAFVNMCLDTLNTMLEGNQIYGKQVLVSTDRTSGFGCIRNAQICAVEAFLAEVFDNSIKMNSASALYTKSQLKILLISHQA